MTPSDDLFLTQLYQRCKDRPLDQGDREYEPLYDTDRQEDPVQALYQCILREEVQSLQYFSGFRGAGKTTELKRLAARLTSDGYRVFHVSANDYLDLSNPLTITDLLLVLAGAFSDALEERGYAEIRKLPFHRRLLDFIKGVGIDVTAIPGLAGDLFGSKLGALKLTFRNEPTFRDKLRQLLDNRLSEFKAVVDKFFEDGLKAIRKKDGPDRRVVFIFDQMENLRGSVSNHAEVVNSVQALFRTHTEKLALPYIHLICTVPPWLRFVVPGLETTMLTGLRLWQNKPARPPRAEGWDQMRRILARRFPGSDMERFFGPPDTRGRYPLAEEIIGASSGVLRDLLRLLRKAINLAIALPIDERTVELTVKDLRNSYQIFAEEDAFWLHDVGQRRDTAVAASTTEDLERFTRFVDAHAVLIFSNGEHWHDLHALVREDVARIVRRAKKRKSAAQPASAS